MAPLRGAGNGRGAAGAVIALTGVAAVALALGITMTVQKNEKQQNRKVKKVLKGKEIEKDIPIDETEVDELFNRDCGRNKYLQKSNVDELLARILKDCPDKTTAERISRIVRGCCTQAVLAQPLMVLMAEESKHSQNDSHILLHKSLRTVAVPAENKIIHDLEWKIVKREDVEAHVGSWRAQFEISFSQNQGDLAEMKGIITAERELKSSLLW